MKAHYREPGPVRRTACHLRECDCPTPVTEDPTRVTCPACIERLARRIERRLALGKVDLSLPGGLWRDG